MSLAKITFTDNKNNIGNQDKQQKSGVQGTVPEAAEEDVSASDPGFSEVHPKREEWI